MERVAAIDAENLDVGGGNSDFIGSSSESDIDQATENSYYGSFGVAMHSSSTSSTDGYSSSSDENSFSCSSSLFSDTSVDGVGHIIVKGLPLKSRESKNSIDKAKSIVNTELIDSRSNPSLSGFSALVPLPELPSSELVGARYLDSLELNLASESESNISVAGNKASGDRCSAHQDANSDAIKFDCDDQIN